MGVPSSLRSDGDHYWSTSSKKSFLPAANVALFFPAYKSKLLTPEKTNPPLTGRTFLMGGRWDSNPRLSEPQSDVLTS